MKYKEYGPHELEVMRNATKSRETDPKELLFGFSNIPFGMEMFDAYGGFTFLLYKTGLIKVQEFIFFGALAEERRYCVPKDCVEKIQLLYNTHYDRVQSLYVPDSESYDGGYSCFFFGDKWLDALNIIYHDEKFISHVREMYPDDFEKVMPIVQAENNILDFFYMVCDILKQYDIILKQFSGSVFGEAIANADSFRK